MKQNYFKFLTGLVTALAAARSDEAFEYRNTDGTKKEPEQYEKFAAAILTMALGIADVLAEDGWILPMTDSKEGTE